MDNPLEIIWQIIELGMKSSCIGPLVVFSEGELASHCQRAGYEPDQEVSDLTTGCQEPGLACWVRMILNKNFLTCYYSTKAKGWI